MPSARQKKDRKAPAHTLHDFFAPKPLIGTQSKPTLQSATKTPARVHPAQEVIIIDSDSDDAVEFVESTSAKRRKLSPRNVEPIPSATLLVQDAVVSSKENSRVFFSQTTTRGSTDCVIPKSEESFGQPFLLVPEPVEAEVALQFGEPVLLLHPETWKAKSTVASTSKQTLDLTPCKDPVDIDLTLGHWEYGDDEALHGSISNDYEQDWTESGDQETYDIESNPRHGNDTFDNLVGYHP